MTTVSQRQTSSVPGMSRRWTVLALALAIGSSVWLVNGKNEMIRRSRKLRIGMTEAEVREIMGELYSRTSSMGGQRVTTVFASSSERWLAHCKRERAVIGFVNLDLPGAGGSFAMGSKSSFSIAAQLTSAASTSLWGSELFRWP